MKLLLAKIFVLSFLFLNIGLSENKSSLEETDKYNREFASSQMFSQNEKEFTNPNVPYLTFIGSDNGLVHASTLKSGDKNYQITFVDEKTFNPYRVESIQIQNNVVITYADKQFVYYRHLLNFYRYSFDKQEFERINRDDTTIFDITIIDDTYALCLGNIRTNEKNDFSFFLLNVVTGKVKKISKSLEHSSENNSIPNSLKYVGEFIRNDNAISYAFDFYGKIMLFDIEGEFKSEIVTIDKIEAPEISHFLDTYTYKRGTTFFTNAGTLLKGNNLFVFSCRPNDKEYITIDRYNLETGKYTESFKLEYQSKKSSDINFISSNRAGEFTLGFDNFYQGFNADLDICQE